MDAKKFIALAAIVAGAYGMDMEHATDDLERALFVANTDMQEAKL